MKLRRLSVVTITLLLALAPALCAVPTIEPDRELQRRIDAIVGPRAGTVVVFDTRTSRVVAVTHPEVAFQTLRPPGSVMKVVTAVALLESRAVSPADTVRCTNHVTIAGRSFTCGVEGGHGVVNVRSALSKSCSVYFYSMGQRVSAQRVISTARRLGLGAFSPFPAGVASQLAVPATQRDRTLMLVGEGRAVRITPWDAIVLVTRLRDARDEAARFVYACMRDVVSSGTGRAAARPGVDVRGKTGTATWNEKPRADAPPRTHGWFAGTAGRLAFVVYLHEGTGRDAAALAGRVLAACEGHL